MPSLEIRSAQNGHQDDIFDILLSTFETTWKPNLTSEGLAHAHDISERYHAYVDQYWPYFFVATHDRKPVGMAHYYDNFVEALHVHKSAQGNGAGAALLDHICKKIAEKHDEVRLETDSFNVRTIGFYMSQGFVERDRYPDEEWKSDFTTVLMAKSLNNS